MVVEDVRQSLEAQDSEPSLTEGPVRFNDVRTLSSGLAGLGEAGPGPALLHRCPSVFGSPCSWTADICYD